MAERRRAEDTPAECANCGAAIPPGARACPECGADERTGWRETEASRYDGLELPDEAWTDDDRGTGRESAGRRQVNGIKWYWWCAGVALVLLLVFAWLALL